MAKDINSEAFSEETKLKLSIFRDCFKEWLPVFLNNPYIKEICIFDLFAGSGKDSEGTSGSPIILLQETRGEKGKYCKQVYENDKLKINLLLNEKNYEKFNLLKENVSCELRACKSTCSLNECILERNCFVSNKDFKELISNRKLWRILYNKSFGKFILLDQYGFRHITDKVFLKLVNAPNTDFIFFISTSFIRRFIREASVYNYFDQENIKFNTEKPKECHREIANYFKALIPIEKEYYVHHFTIKKVLIIMVLFLDLTILMAWKNS